MLKYLVKKQTHVWTNWGFSSEIKINKSNAEAREINENMTAEIKNYSRKLIFKLVSAKEESIHFLIGQYKFLELKHKGQHPKQAKQTNRSLREFKN